MVKSCKGCIHDLYKAGYAPCQSCNENYSNYNVELNKIDSNNVVILNNNRNKSLIEK